MFILIIFKLIYYQIKLDVLKKIKVKIIIHKNCNLVINSQINLIFSSVQLSQVSLIIGFSIISFLYLLLPPNLIPEIYAKIASEIPALGESYFLPSR